MLDNFVHGGNKCHASAEPTETLLTTITPTGKTTYSETPSGVVSVTATNVTMYGASYGWVWYYEGSLSVTAEEGYTITKCVFRQSTKTPITDTEAPFEIHASGGRITESGIMDGVTSIEVYGTSAHTHEWATAWSNDATYHWHACIGHIKDDGTVEIIKCEFDPETGIATFLTDSFSCYFLMYEDAPVATDTAVEETDDDDDDAEDTDDDIDDDTEESDSTISDDDSDDDYDDHSVDNDVDETNPGTGVSAGFGLLAVCAVTAGAALAVKKRKK